MNTRSDRKQINIEINIEICFVTRKYRRANVIIRLFFFTHANVDFFGISCLDEQFAIELDP